MATLNFEVEYEQPDSSAVAGTITFRYEGDSGTIVATRPADGRLDQLDDMVTSVDSFPVTLDGAEFDAMVECTRTQVDRMDVKVVFFGNVFQGAENPTWTGSGFGYGSEGERDAVLQTVIEDVPLDF